MEPSKDDGSVGDPPHAQPQSILGALVSGLVSALVVSSPMFLAIALKVFPGIRYYVVGLLAVYYGHVYWTDYPRRGGRPWEWFGQKFPAVAKLRTFFSFKVHIPEQLKPHNMTKEDKFMFGVHPHGIDAVQRTTLDTVFRETFPNLGSWRALAASVVFLTPGLRELALWTHGIDASRPVVEKAMGEDKHSIMVVPGGEQEQMMTRFKQELVYIKKRAGFIRLALKYGYRIVPIYIFGVNDLFKTSDVGIGLRMWLMKTFHIAIPLYWGPYGIPFAPFKVPLNAVCGKPLGPFPTGEPSEELLQQVHEQYIAELVRVFDENKANFGYADRSLIIV